MVPVGSVALVVTPGYSGPAAQVESAEPAAARGLKRVVMAETGTVETEVEEEAAAVFIDNPAPQEVEAAAATRLKEDKSPTQGQPDDHDHRRRQPGII